MIFISTPSPIYMSSILLGQVSLLMNLISTPSNFHNDPTELLLTAEEPVLILDLINKQRDFDPILWFNRRKVQHELIGWVSDHIRHSKVWPRAPRLGLAHHHPNTLVNCKCSDSLQMVVQASKQCSVGSNMSSYISWLGLIPTPSSPWQPWQLFQIKNSLK